METSSLVRIEQTIERVLILRGEGARQNELHPRTESGLLEKRRSKYYVSHSYFFSVQLPLDLHRVAQRELTVC